MSPDSGQRPGEITELLRAHQEGDEQAFDRLVRLVYDELCRLARGQLRRRPPIEQVDTASLVHRVYVKLADRDPMSLQDREHFFAVAARAMRHMLVDLARRRSRDKRGGPSPDLPLDEGLVEATRGNAAADADHPGRVVAIDEALDVLEEIDPRLVTVVECRFFAGFTEAETARILDVSTRTVQRDWRRARGLLREALKDRSPDGKPPPW